MHKPSVILKEKAGGNGVPQIRVRKKACRCEDCEPGRKSPQAPIPTPFDPVVAVSTACKCAGCENARKMNDFTYTLRRPCTCPDCILFDRWNTKDVGKIVKESVLAAAGRACTYCGKFAGTVDHIHPRSLGGCSRRRNLVAACKTCNGEKGNLVFPFPCTNTCVGCKRWVPINTKTCHPCTVKNTQRTNAI